MTDDNPYEAPTGSLENEPRHDGDVAAAQVSARTIDLLNQTRPWVRLIGILFWIGTVFLGIACAFLGGGGLFGQNPTLLILAFVYMAMALVYGAFAQALTTYARKIHELNSSGKVRDLEDALEAQKTFWKIAGIATVVGIILYILVLAVIFSGVFVMDNFRPR